MKPNDLLCLAFLLLMLFPASVAAQRWKNLVANGALEGTMGELPKWKFPQRRGERNHPDIYPGNVNTWGVDTQPLRGKGFIGLVAREDGTYEYLVQRLRERLFVGRRFSVKLILCKSATMTSYTILSGDKRVDFSQAVSLRVTLGDTVHEIERIDNTEWQTFEFVFTPNSPVKSIVIQAFHNHESEAFYNGNVMIDTVIINQVSP